MPCKHRESFEEQPCLGVFHFATDRLTHPTDLRRQEYLLIATRSDHKEARKNLACMAQLQLQLNLLAQKTHQPQTRLCLHPSYDISSANQPEDHSMTRNSLVVVQPCSAARISCHINPLSDFSPRSPLVTRSSSGSTYTSRHANPGPFTTLHSLKQRGFHHGHAFVCRSFAVSFLILLALRPFRDHR